MKAYIGKSVAKGTVVAPPSKSYAHRYLIASYLAGGGKVTNLGTSMDIEATKACLEALSSSRILPCNESGSTLRFLIPLALLDGKKTYFSGTKRLFSRGLGIYEDIFQKQHIAYQKEECGLHLQGTLMPGSFELSGDVSSQFISGLLFALPLLEGDSVIKIQGPLESAPYIDMTIDVLARYGVQIQKEDNAFFIKGKQKYSPIDTTVEGDESNAAFFDALNYLGGEVVVQGLNPNTLQGDRVHHEIFPLLASSAPCIDLSNSIDLGPICFALASLLHGARFKGIHRLRIKESDRVKDMADICRFFGASIEEQENEITILPSSDTKPLGELVVPNDHRLVMASAIMMSTRAGTLVGIEAVKKSFPNFFDELRKLGVEVRIDD